MGTSGATATGGRARPLPGTTRRAHVLDAAAVDDELDRLWAEAGGGPGPGQGPPDDGLAAADTDDEAFASSLVRANTLNLIAIARSGGEGDRIADVITNLAGFFPSRAIILVADPTRPPDQETGLDVRVRLLEGTGATPSAIRFECVTVACPGDADRLASIASPLLIAELPDVLWWPGDRLADDHLFAELTEVVDRLIIDTATHRDLPGSLGALAAMLATDPCPVVSDLAWKRLTPWRQLVAQFFDAPDARRSLDAVDNVTIAYAAGAADAGSGLSAALLTVGWLGTCLGWEPGDHDDGALTLRNGLGRPVRVALHAADHAPTDQGLSEVRLDAHGEAPASFSAVSGSATTLRTSSESPTMPRVDRLVHVAPLDEAATLSEGLREFARNRVYERALTFAAGLPLPEGATA